MVVTTHELFERLRQILIIINTNVSRTREHDVSIKAVFSLEFEVDIIISKIFRTGCSKIY